MPRYGLLGEYQFSNTEDAASDIRGSKVYGPEDNKLGKIDDVIFDQNTGAIIFVVIDTGGWLSSKKFIVPPQHLSRSEKHEDDFQVSLTKEQIERFPAYDEEKLKSDEQWADYEGRYRSHWATGPVMHREATDRNITPTTKQQIDAGSGSIPSTEDEAAEAPITTPVTEGEMDYSPAGPSIRWTTFEDKLKLRREEVLQSSIDARKRAETPSERERDLRRKAS